MFVVRARKWNWEMLARLHSAQKALANNPNDFLLELEHQLISKYFLILMQEEEYWALKSRLNTPPLETAIRLSFMFLRWLGDIGIKSSALRMWRVIG